ncbi:hypothetical protein [Clostridium gasigenes]|uniref:Uncharacterized protein n=1 Tax=Clostridium gasigenes TaxID=94869 RepID=A0A1H0PQA1_9CLOT|nr:hypothetical protein [Clostridium gasigenes]SDP06738.1 hypothetical protein SAMN04488529_10212 [Clostridium gasigenes]
MNVVAFYISEYGFGHDSRNIPIISYVMLFKIIKMLESLEKRMPNYKENKFNNSYKEIANKYR